ISVNGVPAGEGLSGRRSGMSSMLRERNARPFSGGEMQEVIVRRALLEDGPVLLALIRDLAEYERLDPPDTEAQARLLADIFAPTPRIEAYLAEIDGEAVGYAIALETYSSFLARPTLYLEDLFVRPDRRRRGAGGAMLKYLAAEAVARG